MKPRAILALLGIVLLAAGGWWWWHAGTQQALVASALPALPDLRATSPALGGEVAAANARARGRLPARRGLVELSRLYHGNGFFAEALACYSILEQLEPSEPRWLHLHAFILANYG